MNRYMASEEQIESQLRKFTIDKLQALRALLLHSSHMITTAEISDATNTESNELGGILSSLTRTKIDGEPIIMPVVKSNDQGMIWKFNEGALPRETTLLFVNKILHEAQPYIKSV